MRKRSADHAGSGSAAAALTPGQAAALARLVEGGRDGLGVDDEDVRALENRGLARAADRPGRVVATELGRARAARDACGPLGFLAQHRALDRRTVVVDDRAVEALVDLDESPLAWLARRKGRDGRPLLAAHEVAAGERLRIDFDKARMAPRVTANWEASVPRGRRNAGGHGLEPADAVISARARVTRALQAVGPELSGALIDVCCFLKGLEEVERDRGWPARGAKLVLGLGLARLARHYGYVSDAPQGPAGIVRWGTADSRPVIDGAAESGSS